MLRINRNKFSFESKGKVFAEAGIPNNSTRVFEISYHSLIITVLICLVVSPFIVPSNIMYSFLTGPQLWFYLIIAILLMTSSVKLLLTINQWQHKIIKVDHTDMLMVSTLMYLSISQVLLSNTAYFTDKFLTYILLIFLFFIIKNYVLALKKLQLFSTILIIIFLIISLISCVYGLLQFFNIIENYDYGFKVTGHFHNPARYACYLAALIPFCFTSYFFFPKKSEWHFTVRCLSSIVCLIAFSVLIITNIRAAWVGVFISIFIILFLKYKSDFLKLFSRIWVSIIITILIIALSSLLYNLKPESVLGRFTIWKISLNIIKEHPLIGIGYGNFEGNYDSYQAKYFSNDITGKENEILSADIVRYPYNIFIQILCEQGLIGISLFIRLLWVLIIQFLDSIHIAEDNFRKFLSLAAFSSVISILISGQFSYPFDILPVLTIYFINLGIISGTRFNKFSGKTDNKSPNTLLIKPLPLALASCLLIFCSLLLFQLFNYKYNAYKTWLGLENRNSRNMAKLYPALKDNINFIESYSTILFNENKYKDVINLLENPKNPLMYPSVYLNLAQSYFRIGNYEKAEKYFLHAANMVPNKFYSKYLLVKFYYHTKQFDKAYKLSYKIMKMKIKVPSKTVLKIRKEVEEQLLSFQHIEVN